MSMSKTYGNFCDYRCTSSPAVLGCCTVKGPWKDLQPHLFCTPYLQVPTVAVIGDQSYGKSSIIQRICGVNLPRSNGTCTRCPTEVRLTDSVETGRNCSWSCAVKLCWAYSPDGSSASIPREKLFGPVITDREQVEAAVRNAQRAILNPGEQALLCSYHRWFKDSTGEGTLSTNALPQPDVPARHVGTSCTCACPARTMPGDPIHQAAPGSQATGCDTCVSCRFSLWNQ